MASTESWPRGAVMRTRVEDVAAEAHDGRGDRIDGDLEGEDDDAVGFRANHRRGPAGRAERFGSLLGDEAAGRELPDQPADRAPRQPRARDELRARQRTAGMELAGDGAQVGASNRLAALTDRVAAGRHRVCQPLVQKVVLGCAMAVAVSRRAPTDSVAAAPDGGCGAR